MVGSCLRCKALGSPQELLCLVVIGPPRADTNRRQRSAAMSYTRTKNFTPVMMRLRLQMLRSLSIKCSWNRRMSSGVGCHVEQPVELAGSSRQRYPLRRYVNVAVRRNPKAQDCVTKTIRDPFTTQFTPMPRGKIAYLAASFRHINACARGEIPIVAAPPPFPTRDFLPWRFSAAGRRSAWRDRHPGSRKPTQNRKSADLTRSPRRGRG